MNDYRKNILKKIEELERILDKTPYWKMLKIIDINSKITEYGKLFEEDLKKY